MHTNTTVAIYENITPVESYDEMLHLSNPVAVYENITPVVSTITCPMHACNIVAVYENRFAGASCVSIV